MELFNNNLYMNSVAGFIIASTVFFAYAIYRFIDAEKDFKHHESMDEDEGGEIDD